MPFSTYDYARFEYELKTGIAIPGGHAAIRMNQRQMVYFKRVCQSVLSGYTVIEPQGPDKFLVLSWMDGRPLHTAWVVRPGEDVFLATLYHPDERPDLWEANWKTRKPRP